MAIDAGKIRSALLAELATRAGSHHVQPATVLNAVAKSLGIRDSGSEAEALLTLWSDLFRTGYIAWGFDLSNVNPPFFHITAQGRRVLASWSRDPSNPDGYRAYLASKVHLNPIAQSYLSEALDTFISGSFKAAAVMIGAASESLILELRDAIVLRLDSLGRPIPKELENWQVKRVLGAIQAVLSPLKSTMGAQLFEAFEVHWPAFTQQIRSVRNDAGHPASIDPISQESVHASLLIFPELASVVARLVSWTATMP